MQAGSTRAQTRLLERLDEILDDEVDAEALGEQLFALVATLDAEPSLRRVLTEPAVSPEVRQAIAASLLEGKVDAPALSVVRVAVAERWSRTRDLAEALESCAVRVEATRADRDGDLDDLEDDLFRFGRILAAHADLRDALADRSAPLAARRRLLDGLIADKVGPVTRGLLDQLLVGRHQSLSAGLARYQALAASRRDRLVAVAWVATPLTDDQRTRLIASLARQYDRDVHLNVVVDPSVLGGVRIAIGDDVIDSTVESRLVDAQRRMVR
jgi:F-type H+-transporting ATPase subunit delta